MNPPKMIFREGPIQGLAVVPLQRFADSRGWLVELFREDECGIRPAMTYVSQTLPGVVRGPHEHREQSDCFAFVGPGDFQLYVWDAREASPSFGHKQVVLVGESNRVQVVVPPGVVHAYKNVGGSPGLVFNSPDRLYAGPGRREPVDEIRHEDRPDSPFRLDA
jgi:dTDP-4-dehydrorhamnose 3,5-epimerase